MESEDVVEIAFRSVDINESGSVSKTVRNIVTVRPYHIAEQYFLVREAIPREKYSFF